MLERFKTSVPCKMVSINGLTCSICNKFDPPYVIRIGLENKIDICYICAVDIEKATYCKTFYGDENVEPEDGYPIPAKYDI